MSAQPSAHPSAVTVHHLFEHPALREATARLIHDEFWTTVPGASPEAMARRLAQAARPDAVPLCRVALHQGALVGVVNLVESDDDQRDWTPWLAGLVVAEPWRGRGVGSLLVRTLLADARALGVTRLYFGTDGPGFYQRLGAVEHERVRADFCFMRFDLPAR